MVVVSPPVSLIAQTKIVAVIEMRRDGRLWQRQCIPILVADRISFVASASASFSVGRIAHTRVIVSVAADEEEGSYDEPNKGKHAELRHGDQGIVDLDF